MAVLSLGAAAATVWQGKVASDRTLRLGAFEWISLYWSTGDSSGEDFGPTDGYAYAMATFVNSGYTSINLRDIYPVEPESHSRESWHSSVLSLSDCGDGATLLGPGEAVTYLLIFPERIRPDEFAAWDVNGDFYWFDQPIDESSSRMLAYSQTPQLEDIFRTCLNGGLYPYDARISVSIDRSEKADLVD